MPQEPVHLARVRAWLACRRRRLLLLIHEFVLVKLVDVHPTEARRQRIPGHGRGLTPAPPALLRIRPQIHSARNRLGGGKRSPRTTSTSPARSRCRPPTSGPRRNRKCRGREERGPVGAPLKALYHRSCGRPDLPRPDSLPYCASVFLAEELAPYPSRPSILDATTALVLRPPSCIRRAPGPGRGRRRHSPDSGGHHAQTEGAPDTQEKAPGCSCGMPGRLLGEETFEQRDE